MYVIEVREREGGRETGAGRGEGGEKSLKGESDEGGAGGAQRLRGWGMGGEVIVYILYNHFMIVETAAFGHFRFIMGAFRRAVGPNGPGGRQPSRSDAKRRLLTRRAVVDRCGLAARTRTTSPP